MKFDCYAGNVWGGVHAEQVAEVVSFGAHARVSRGRPRGRYTDVFDLKVAEDLVGWVARDAQLETAYFEFKGACTPNTAGSVRRHWPDAHTVSRLDSCEDYNAPGAFDLLVALIDAAKDPRVQSKAITPRDGDRGSTIYWGSTQSRVMVRCYEAGKMKERAHLAKPNWTRVESQIRPGKSAEKKLAASITPLEAWGFSEWSRKAAEALSHCEVGRYAPLYEPVQFDKTTLYFARAFRRHLEQMELDLGDWECIGREIKAVWSADDESAKRWAAQ